jgi:hypothetical protein
MAVVAAVFAGLAVIDLVLGPLLAGAGIVTPLVAFAIFAIGLLEGLIALVLGLLAVFLTRPATG